MPIATGANPQKDPAAAKAERDAGWGPAGGGGDNRDTGAGRPASATPTGATINGPADFNSMMGGGEDPDAVKAANAGAVNKQKAYRDYSGDDDSFLDKIGNLIASAFGFNELNPYNDAAPNATGTAAPAVTGKASWAVDPISLALGIGGLAFGPLSALGWGYHGMKAISGWAGPQIGLDGGTAQPSAGVGDGATLDRGIGRAGNRVGYDQGLARPTNAVPAPAAVAPSPAPLPDPDVASLLDPTGRNRNNTALVL